MNKKIFFKKKLKKVLDFFWKKTYIKCVSILIICSVIFKRKYIKNMKYKIISKFLSILKFKL